MAFAQLLFFILLSGYLANICCVQSTMLGPRAVFFKPQVTTPLVGFNLSLIRFNQN